MMALVRDERPANTRDQDWRKKAARVGGHGRRCPTCKRVFGDDESRPQADRVLSWVHQLLARFADGITTLHYITPEGNAVVTISDAFAEALDRSSEPPDADRILLALERYAEAQPMLCGLLIEYCLLERSSRTIADAVGVDDHTIAKLKKAAQLQVREYLAGTHN